MSASWQPPLSGQCARHIGDTVWWLDLVSPPVPPALPLGTTHGAATAPFHAAAIVYLARPAETPILPHPAPFFHYRSDPAAASPRHAFPVAMGLAVNTSGRVHEAQIARQEGGM